jgi:glycyl-tRNA synthetase alpha subunit
VRTMSREIAQTYYASREALGFPMLDSAGNSSQAAS